MKSKKILYILFVTIGFIILLSFKYFKNDRLILSHIVDLKKSNLNFYWKSKDGNIINTFSNLKKHLKDDLIFATNGGMFKKGYSPQGLYIENGKVLSKIDTISKGYGNFYLQPNGVFYISEDKKANICETKKFKNIDVKYATQSGPMLVVDNKIHPMLMKGSKNLNIRNGVGVLPNGQIIFVMSKQKINFHSFATYFKTMGCKNALYLDGFISRTYLPSKNWKSEDGRFGVIIGQTK